MDKIIHGDCLDVLRQMPDEQIDLIYLDPPFFTQKIQSLKSKSKQEYSFNDTWESMAHYLDFLRVRLVEMRRVMKANASLFFHCDKNASHHIRFLLDDIFGVERFLSEIIWTYRRWSNSSRALLPAHQTIYMYSKTEKYTFNTLMQPYSETTNLDQILQMRIRNEDGKTVYAEDDEGDVILNGPKMGVPLSDTWSIPYLNPKAKERTGYPTQKPLLLLERIIKLASNPADTILDPFAGSGTTLVAAQMLERNFIGIDISADAVELAQKRLSNPVKSTSSVLANGRDTYDNLPDYVKNIIQTIKAKPVQRNSGIDAIYDTYSNGQPIVIRVQRYGEPLLDAANKLKRAGKTKLAAVLVLIKTNDDQMTLPIDNLMPSEVTIVNALELIIQQLLPSVVTDVHNKLKP